MSELTDQMEQGLETPWAVNDAPERYLQTMLRGIIGVEIEVTHLAGKFKLSQNHPLHNRMGVAEGLKEVNHPMAKMISTEK